jgi:hypothetical protein
MMDAQRTSQGDSSIIAAAWPTDLSFPAVISYRTGVMYKDCISDSASYEGGQHAISGYHSLHMIGQLDGHDRGRAGHAL